MPTQLWSAVAVVNGVLRITMLGLCCANSIAAVPTGGGGGGGGVTFWKNRIKVRIGRVFTPRQCPQTEGLPVMRRAVDSLWPPGPNERDKPLPAGGRIPKIVDLGGLAEFIELCMIGYISLMFNMISIDLDLTYFEKSI